MDHLIKLIKNGQTIEIVKHSLIREDNGCKYYELELLEKKYWLMRGILYQSLNRQEESRDSFLQCLLIGEHLYHRIRKEVLARLIVVTKRIS